MKRLSSDEARWNAGWTCDVCGEAVDRFRQPTGGRPDDEAAKVTRHWRCHEVRVGGNVGGSTSVASATD